MKELNFNCWKQKIPTNLFKFFGEDHTARMMYQEFLMMAAFNDNIEETDRPKNGQCFFSLAKLGKRFRMTKEGCRRVVARLTVKYNLVKITTTDKCSICTLLNYNEVTGKNDAKKTPVDGQLTDSTPKYQHTAIIINNNAPISEETTVNRSTVTEPKQVLLPRPAKKQAPTWQERAEHKKYLLTLVSRSAFEESGEIESGLLKHHVNLLREVGQLEYEMRAKKLMQSDFHKQNMGSLKYSYGKIKGHFMIGTVRSVNISTKSAIEEGKYER